LPAKAFAPQGQVMHCGSFSKCLAPGYRVGWAAPGPYLRQLQRLKLMSSLGVSLPAQAGLSEYLQGGAYDAHLRRLRAALASQQQAMLAALHEQLPAGSRMTRPRGGYFIWVELPAGCDALLLQRQLLAEGISTAPGPIFSARAEFRHCLRLNSGHPWDARMAAGIARLGALARAQLAH
jgi:DNA-binding transcriptional MocR family regulator